MPRVRTNARVGLRISAQIEKILLSDPTVSDRKMTDKFSDARMPAMSRHLHGNDDFVSLQVSQKREPPPVMRRF